jgi:predicted Zn-dependent protease
MARAAELWEDAFRRAPGRSGIGLNLARLYCGVGEFRRALDVTERELEFNPDDPQAKALLRQLVGDSPKCGVK